MVVFQSNENKPRKLLALSYNMSESDEDESREDRKARIVSMRYYHFILRSVRYSSLGVVSCTCDPVLALGQRFDFHSRRLFCYNHLGLGINCTL